MIVALTTCLSNRIFAESCFKKDISSKYEDTLFYDFQPGRSEWFPVSGFETNEGWKIATIRNEEVFFLTFDGEKEAKLCYMRSVEEYGEEISDFLWQYGNDIVYYRGTELFIDEMIEEMVFD